MCAEELASVDWARELNELRELLVGGRLLGALVPLPAEHPARTGAATDPAALGGAPCAIGATVGVDVDAPGFAVTARWTCEDGTRVGGTRRLPNTAGLIGPWTLDDAHPGVVIRLHVHWHEADWIVSTLLVNEGAERIFDPELAFEGVDDDPIIVRRPWLIDPGEVGWQDYDYDPDFIPVHAAPARFGIGHGAALELELVEMPKELVGRRVRAVPFALSPAPPGDPAIEAAEGAVGDARVPLAACLEWDDETLHQRLADVVVHYHEWLEAERSRRPDAKEGCGPFLNGDALAQSRFKAVAADALMGVESISAKPLAGWAFRMASWIVMRETGRERWRADELVWLLAMVCWAMGSPITGREPVADLVDFAPGARHQAHLGLAAFRRAWLDR